MIKKIYAQNVIACVWDFDKTLIPGYMQAPIFEHYGLDEHKFWQEVHALPQKYQERGCIISKETAYLNHLLTYAREGYMRGLNNKALESFGQQLKFFPGLPDFFEQLRQIPKSQERYRRYGLRLEHYIISSGLAALIRGSQIAPHVEGIYGCEFIESPFAPGFLDQPDLSFFETSEIAQVGRVVDNTIKTRFIFEINKGSNTDQEIDVNAKVDASDRRIPIENMLYIADGPSDVPVFCVVKKEGGKVYAVYDPSKPKDFEQNDNLLQTGRIHAYGPADYRPDSSTAHWLTMHVNKICERIASEAENTLAARRGDPPKHDPPDLLGPDQKGAELSQAELSLESASRPK